MAEKSFLGTGTKFPFDIDKATGRVKTVSGNQSVKEAIYIILMTGLTERLTRPDFGTNIMAYTFMSTSPTVMGMMRRELTQSLLAQEPRVSDVDVEMELSNSNDYMLINIDYTVAATNQRDNLVFPFYLNIDEDVEADEEEYYDADAIEEDVD